MNHISINTPVKVINTGDSNVDGLTGRITGIAATDIFVVIYIITLDKLLNTWSTIAIPDRCLEIIH